MLRGMITLALISASSIASADVYLSIGETVRIGGEQIHCGVNEPQDRMYRCSMEVCIDPWNDVSDSEWMCKHGSGSYNFEVRSEVGSDKQDLFNRLSSGVHRPDTFSCTEI